MTEQELKMRIMRRVRWIHTLKRITHPAAVRVYVLSALFIGVASLVSVPNVLANMPALADVSRLYSFMVSAFAHTELVVQIGVLFAFALAVWVVRDVVRMIAAPHSRLSVQ